MSQLEKQIEDLKKAEWYLKKKIQQLEKQKEAQERKEN